MKRYQRYLALLISLLLLLAMCPASALGAENPVCGFGDVDEADWFADSVRYAYDHDLMKGTSETTFEPQTATNRAMVVTILYRQAGSPFTVATHRFADVPAGQWYTGAVAWAEKNGVIGGYSAGSFGPNDPITREQMAAILYRYARLLGADVTRTDSLDRFDDAASVSDWAKEAMQWAVGSSLINGMTETTLSPRDGATRAQAAALLMRFIENVAPEPPAAPKAYRFEPKVVSSFQREVFGDKICDAWLRMVDAILAGRDSFPCPDEHTYDWVIGQFPDQCLPVLTTLIAPAYDPNKRVVNGVGHFRYLVPQAEAAGKIEAFAARIEDILNGTLQPGDSPFEQMHALYQYFEDNYTYDYDAYEDNQHGDAYYLASYRVFSMNTGICQELSVAYSYLLMQLGIDATIVKGDTGFDLHQWSYVTLNGRNYHIDPTYVLDSGYDLAYFLMTDAQREYTGCAVDSFIYTSTYAQDHPHPVYKAEDETFKALWDGYFRGLDREKNILTYMDSNTWKLTDFDYSGY